MTRTFALFALPLLVPVLLGAQGVPSAHASDSAKAAVAAHRATHFRGMVVGFDGRPVSGAAPAVPATHATPATPSAGGGPATPASPAAPATPAVPATPSHKPTSPGQSTNHRP